MSFMKINPGHGFYPICLCEPFLHILTLNFINDQTHLSENNPGKGICGSYQPLWKVVLCCSLHLFSRLLTLPIVQQVILIFFLSLKKTDKRKTHVFHWETGWICVLHVVFILRLGCFWKKKKILAAKSFYTFICFTTADFLYCYSGLCSQWISNCYSTVCS